MHGETVKFTGKYLPMFSSDTHKDLSQFFT